MNDFKILVAGSLAFDVMFSIPNDFRQSIPLKNGTIDHLNATYVANQKSEYPGGTAGNIAAWLGEVGGTSSIFSAWGTDLETKGYQAKLESKGHELKGRIGGFTAHCYNVSDPLHQQIVIWQPNFYEANKTQSLSEFYSPEKLQNFKQAIFSAGTPDSILKHMTEFRAANKEAQVIFDPGQVSPFFTEEQFRACVSLSDIIIGNRVEAEHFERYMHNFWPEAVTQITTLGADGVSYQVGRNSVRKNIPAINATKVLETTGAGDAFRAGLIYALSQSQTLEEALNLGNTLGVKSVELDSPQPA
ncbi:hypothetical protein GW756_03500 [bacterium]|nr:hypothetical protein [bacterium]NCQ55416.1 hypothetical protein [Candidatus Parcubacteria bacterium]NCS67778.1 hypothetical protein [Candidatus Peregrinibacteria bacterium]NCS96408.1 hypothetical protein [bacterium]